MEKSQPAERGLKHEFPLASPSPSEAFARMATHVEAWTRRPVSIAGDQERADARFLELGEERGTAPLRSINTAIDSPQKGVARKLLVFAKMPHKTRIRDSLPTRWPENWPDRENCAKKPSGWPFSAFLGRFCAKSGVHTA